MKAPLRSVHSIFIAFLLVKSNYLIGGMDDRVQTMNDLDAGR